MSGKGYLSDQLYERVKLDKDNIDKLTMPLVDSLRTTKYQLSQMFIKGTDTSNVSYSFAADSLQRLAQQLESKLARSNVHLRKSVAGYKVDIDEIAEALPEQSILIEYVKFNYLSK